jgi:hypothetical protein
VARRRKNLQAFTDDVDHRFGHLKMKILAASTYKNSVITGGSINICDLVTEIGTKDDQGPF